MSFIVVGIDGSESAELALRAAVDQAKWAEVEIRVINVVMLPTLGSYDYGPIDLNFIEESAEKMVTATLDKLDAEYGGSVPVPISTRIVFGHAGNEIINMAKEDGGAAMVVVGSRGYGGFKSLLLGSVTTYLAHHLAAPLLIIPTPDED